MIPKRKSGRSCRARSRRMQLRQPRPRSPTTAMRRAPSRHWQRRASASWASAYRCLRDPPFALRGSGPSNLHRVSILSNPYRVWLPPNTHPAWLLAKPCRLSILPKPSRASASPKLRPSSLLPNSSARTRKEAEKKRRPGWRYLASKMKKKVSGAHYRAGVSLQPCRALGGCKAYRNILLQTSKNNHVLSRETSNMIHHQNQFRFIPQYCIFVVVIAFV